MTFNAPSFFVGVGTVLALLTFGFGGGVLVSGILSDNAPREPNKVERRAAAPEAAPPTITTKPVPVLVAPVPTELQASTPNPDPSPKPSESASAPAAQPPAPAQQQAQPVTPAADTVTPALGPQQPVALVNPNQAQDHGGAITQQARRLSDMQRAKRLADERKNAERRKAERLRQRETRQVERRAPAGSSSEDDADNDVRGDRRFFILRERPERLEFGPPSLFRFFDQ